MLSWAAGVRKSRAICSRVGMAPGDKCDVECAVCRYAHQAVCWLACLGCLLACRPRHVADRLLSQRATLGCSELRCALLHTTLPRLLPQGPPAHAGARVLLLPPALRVPLPRGRAVRVWAARVGPAVPLHPGPAEGQAGGGGRARGRGEALMVVDAGDRDALALGNLYFLQC